MGNHEQTGAFDDVLSEETGTQGAFDNILGEVNGQDPIDDSSIEGLAEVTTGTDTSNLDEIISELENSGDFQKLRYARQLREIIPYLSDENIAGLSGVITRLENSSDDELEAVMDEFLEATRAFQDEIERARQIAYEQEQDARRANLQVLLEEARSIELTGHIESGEWSEVMTILQEQLMALDIDISDEELQKFQVIFDAMRNSADSVEVSLQATNQILDNIIDQAEEHGDATEFTVTISKNNFIQEAWEQSVSFISMMSMGYISDTQSSSFEMTFPDSETAIRFALGIKQALKEIEDIEFIDWLNDIVIDALIFTAEGVWEADKFVFDLIMEDLDFTFTNGGLVMAGSLGAHALGYYLLKTRLDAANSGVSPETTDRLVNHLRETIRIYKSAGFDSDEISNMESLLRDLTEFYPETPEGINDQRFRARYVYSVLQRWRGSVPMDLLRFGASGVGRIFDVNIWSRDSLIGKIPLIGSPIRGIPLLGRGLDFIVKLHAAPLIMGSKLINKGPNGWGIFNTKSGVINSYSDSISNANDTFTRFFAIIDSIAELNATERTALKREILDLYGSARPDPLAETRLGFEPRGWTSMPNFTISLDREASRVIMQAIEDKLGYIPTHLEETFAGIRRNGEAYEAERVNIENARKAFLRFIEYYPALNDTQENTLKSISIAEGLTSENAESFNRQMIRILNDNFGIRVTAEYIKDFGDMVEHESINTGENRNNAQIIEKVDDILLEMRNARIISETEYLARMDTTRNFFTGNKTFWQAHLGLIIQEIIDGKTPTGVSSLDEVNTFIGNGGSRDVFSQLRNILRNISTVSVETTTEVAGDTDTPESERTAPAIIEEAGDSTTVMEGADETPERQSILTAEGYLRSAYQNRYDRILFVYQNTPPKKTSEQLQDLDNRMKDFAYSEANRYMTLDDFNIGLRGIAGIPTEMRLPSMTEVREASARVEAEMYLERVELEYAFAGKDFDAREFPISEVTDFDQFKASIDPRLASDEIQEIREIREILGDSDFTLPEIEDPRFSQIADMLRSGERVVFSEELDFMRQLIRALKSGG